MLYEIKKAVLWGDSIGKGVIYDADRHRYVLTSQSAATTVAQSLGIELTNRCRMGMTVSQGLTMMEKDCDRGLEADTAIIEFGGNDCDFDWSAVSAAPEAVHQPKTPFRDFTKGLQQMIDKVRSMGMTPVLVNCPPVNAERYFQFIASGDRDPDRILRWLGSVHQIYRYQERYSLRVDQLATLNHCPLINVRSAFLDLWRPDDYLCLDGIHPNEKGQQIIAQAVLNAANAHSYV